MNCRYCSQELSEKSSVCSRCGQPVQGRPTASVQASGSSGASGGFGSGSARAIPLAVDPSTQAAGLSTAQAAYQSAAYGSASTAWSAAATGTSRTGRRTRARRRPSTYVIWAMLLMIFVILAYVFYSAVWAAPVDLGVRYTDSDYQLALAKTGISVRFLGMTEAEMDSFLKANRDEKFLLSDYEFAYSNYTLRTFELTPREATAFANEFLPMFSMFRDVQLAVPESGKLSASFRVHVEKARLELLPELFGATRPPFLGRLLPRYLNFELSGPAFVILNSQLAQREQLDVVKTGALSLRPFIGNTDRGMRDQYTTYAERVYRMVPRLRIQSLRINERRNFEFTGTLPIRITIRKL